eukprot:g13109.t1
MPKAAWPTPETDWFKKAFGIPEPSTFEDVHEVFRYDSAAGTLEVPSQRRRFDAGLFERPSLAELRERSAASSVTGAGSGKDPTENDSGVTAARSRLKFRILPKQDVSALHDVARMQTELATFQVASQFNCLEQVSMGMCPEMGVTRWAMDHTQGPACCLCTAPAVVVRNYFTGQRKDCQIDNLKEVTEYVHRAAAAPAPVLDDVGGGVIGEGEVPGGLFAKEPEKNANTKLGETNGGVKFWEVVAGYTKATGGGLDAVPWSRIDRERCKALLRIGVHQDTTVTACGDWGLQALDLSNRVVGLGDASPRVTHALCSGCAIAYNGTRSKSSQWEPLARVVLEACYEATFYAAAETRRRHAGALGSKKLFLTLIGGGVFGNRFSWISDAIVQAVEKFRGHDLEVYLVSFGQVDDNLKMLDARVRKILRMLVAALTKDLISFATLHAPRKLIAFAENESFWTMDLVFISRVVDGLVLVETWESSSMTSASQLKQHAKALLRKINHGPDKCTVDVVGGYQFHYRIEDGVCFMVLTGSDYPKKLAFAFLEEIYRLFLEELKREFGTGAVDYRSRIECIDKPYYFIKFERVQSVMRRNLDELLEKGTKLEEVGAKASSLRDHSKSFKDNAKMLSLQALFRQYAVLGGIGFFILFILWWKLF